MRIVQFSDSFLPIMDGVGNVVYRYALHLGEKGQESYVVAPQTDTGYRGGYPFELIDYLGVPMKMMKSYTVGTPRLDIHCHNRLKMIRPDIVHVHTPFVAGQAGIAFGQKMRCPVVGTFHSKYYDDFLQITGVELLAELGTHYIVSFYEKCSEVWAVSETSAGTLRDYGYTGPIRVMPNGTDVRPCPQEAVEEAARHLPLGAQTPMLLYVGQINWKKNLRCILEALAKVRMPWQLVLAGQGPHEKEVQQLARELSIENRTLFTGHITDPDALNALYRRAKLFVFPSLYDTSGLVVREAAAMGTPSVVVRGSSAAECIRDGENGFLCEDDPEDLARVIERALSTARLEVIGEAARKTIPIPWSDLIDDVLARYRDLAGKDR